MRPNSKLSKLAQIFILVSWFSKKLIKNHWGNIFVILLNCFNPFRPMHFRNLYCNKSLLNFYFHLEGLHKTFLRHHKDVWKQKFKLIFFFLFGIETLRSKAPNFKIKLKCSLTQKLKSRNYSFIFPKSQILDIVSINR